MQLKHENSVIAIIPAAGHATRLPDISCSKEIHPIGYQDQVSEGKPACFYLMEKLIKANINKGIMIIREDKWDIVKTLGSGKCVNMEIAYQILNLPHGTAYTVDQAYPFVKDNIVALGFPDILFSPDDAYIKILSLLGNSDADVVLGLFPADNPQKVDMVTTDKNMLVTDIEIKPNLSSSTLTWGIAVWKPSFTDFLHETLAKIIRQESDKELYIGEVILMAIHQGLKVAAEHVSQSPYLDIGTPDDLARAIKLNR